MTTMTGLFTILSALTIAGAAATMALRNLVHAVLALVLAFAGLATLYLLLGAQFVGLAQILVYVGAVAILMVFAILLTRGASVDARPISHWGTGMAIAVAVFGLLGRSIATSTVSRSPINPQPEITVRQIGDALMGPFVLPLEIVGLLLTGALVGAVIIAVEEKKKVERQVAND
jgi:NADH-quinone oxidoreductase subunit J